jgi:hypothetical protein
MARQRRIATILVLALGRVGWAEAQPTASAVPVGPPGAWLAPVLRAALDAGVDHGPLDAVLRSAAHDGGIDYRAVAADPRLAAYLGALSRAVLPEPGPGRTALAINAYNAFVLDTLSKHWPVTRVVEIDGFFDHLTHSLAGRDLTLDELEDDLLRPLHDPRLHAALFLGARGGPALRPEAYVASAERLEAQLDDQAQRWVRDPAVLRFDRAAHQLWLSPIFRWYAVDFEAVGGPAGFAHKYLADEPTRQALLAGGYELAHLAFDWTVTPAATPAAAPPAGR